MKWADGSLCTYLPLSSYHSTSALEISIVALFVESLTVGSGI